MRSVVRQVRIANRLSTLVVVAALAGCASLGLGGFKEPVVTLRDVRLKGIGLQGGSADVQLSVYNPNGFTLDGTRLTYRVLIDSTPLGEGALEQRFTVQKGDSSVVTLPISFSYAGLGAGARQLLASGSVNYRVVGNVTVSTPLGSFTRPYDRTQRFSTFGR